MELTQEQTEAIAKSVAAQFRNPQEDEPDWIKDIRRISAEEGGKTKKEIGEEVERRLAEIVTPIIRSQAYSAYLDGLEPEYHGTVKEMLKDEYEKNPDGLFRAGQHELTRQMVQDAARFRHNAAKQTTTTTTDPIQTEVITGDPVQIDQMGQNLARMLGKAGITKSPDEINQIVEVKL